MNYEYYYNNVPGDGPSRNNLIYTSLISTDKKTFVQWYYNDVTYHKNQNQVVDPAKMEEKWLREVNYLTRMRNKYPDLVPTIKNIDFSPLKEFINHPDKHVENFVSTFEKTIKELLKTKYTDSDNFERLRKYLITDLHYDKKVYDEPTLFDLFNYMAYIRN